MKATKVIKFTEEHKRKIGLSHIGMKPNKEARKKMSESQKARFARDGGYWKNKKRDTPWMRGVVQSKEQKAKMVATRRRNGSYRKLTEKERLKLSITKPRGEKHYNWKGGITPSQIKIRMSLEMKLWCEEIFKRDNWICQECKQRGGKLETHHIKPFALFPELRFSIDNGLTLCVDCHKRTHSSYRDKKQKLSPIA